MPMLMRKTALSAALSHLLCGLVLWGSAGVSSLSAASSPVITSIRQTGTNVLVSVSVPAGIERITLESRERLGPGGWAPRIVARLDQAGGERTFSMPISRRIELLRVRGDATDPLPRSFYSGTNEFLGEPGSGSGPNFFGPTTADPRDQLGPGQEGSSREVVESDIWKVRGQTLYFFNQLRGLQIIDITNPDAAAIRGTLDLPASGEQMYVLGERHVVLLARNDCFANDANGAVLVVRDDDGTPVIVRKLAVPGYIQESRLVGSALYVASQQYRPVAGSSNSTWEWGTAVTGFDLSDPDDPLARNTLWFAGYGNVVTSTDVLFLVVTRHPSNWWQSIVRSVDVTNPDGTIRAYESITVQGQIPDKFKLRYRDGILTTIAEDWHLDGGRQLVTRLETFRLSDPRALGPGGVLKLGELELGQGERLFATRFDGDRVYVVTFRVIDPLWIVDLDDPANPRIAGHLEVPGYSTYIEPLGDRLVAVGVETSRVAVSLFDVADAAEPALLSMVLFGENYSWSEANWDEKAFTVLPGPGLILVPYNGVTTNGYASRVQLIDLNPDNLVKRGVIEHEFSPRRATLYSDRILSISGWELLSVDATDRDNPVVQGMTSLAWSVDQVFLAGDYLIELPINGGWWHRSLPAAIRLARAESPNDLVAELVLTNLPIVGADVRGDYLYVAQSSFSSFYYPIYDTTGGQALTNEFILSVFDLRNLPALQLAGRTSIELPVGSISRRPVWPTPTTLVWMSGQPDYWFLATTDFQRTASFAPDIWWPHGFGGGGRLLAFDVADPAAPQFASEVTLSRTNHQWWSFSPAFATNGLVYISHRQSEFIIGLESQWQTRGEPTVTTDPATGESKTNSGPIGTWVVRDYLDVVDYRDAFHPMVRDPVNIPGRLTGLSRGGSLLYTIGSQWRPTNWYWKESLTASAYDGVEAHLVDTLELPEVWPHPVHIVDTSVFLGRPGYNYSNTNVAPHLLETWTLSNEGEFTQLGEVTLDAPVYLFADFPGMFAAQDNHRTVILFDLTTPAALEPIGASNLSGCVWPTLEGADGNAARGLWLPLGAYGVSKVEVRQ